MSLSLSDENILELYESGLSGIKIAEKMGEPSWKIYKRLKGLNYSARSNEEKSRKFSIDETFFEEINTEEKAYWLGFLYADGYVSAGRKFGVTLHRKDREHLEKFLFALKYTGEISDYDYETTYSPTGKKTAHSRLLITSRKMTEDLIALGCVERKSNILKPPTFEMSRDLSRHFMRGFFDGDGSVSKSKGARYGIRGKVLGTEEMMLWMQKNIPVRSGIYLDKRHPDIRCLEFSWRGVGFLYENSTVFLDRKKQRVSEEAMVNWKRD